MRKEEKVWNRKPFYLMSAVRRNGWRKSLWHGRQLIGSGLIRRIRTLNIPLLKLFYNSKGSSALTANCFNSSTSYSTLGNFFLPSTHRNFVAVSNNKFQLTLTCILQNPQRCTLHCENNNIEIVNKETIYHSGGGSLTHFFFHLIKINSKFSPESVFLNLFPGRLEQQRTSAEKRQGEKNRRHFSDPQRMDYA